jgi:uncharacterized membrane protein
MSATEHAVFILFEKHSKNVDYHRRTSTLLYKYMHIHTLYLYKYIRKIESA